MLQERKVAILRELPRSVIERAPIPSSDPTPINLAVGFAFVCVGFSGICCFPECSFRIFPARRGQLSLGVSSTPLNPRVSARKESAVKPGSVVDSHSSGMRVAAQL
jgi:hypothetical protein